MMRDSMAMLNAQERWIACLLVVPRRTTHGDEVGSEAEGGVLVRVDT